MNLTVYNAAIPWDKKAVMDKVYLLRNGVKTGPFPLHELMREGLLVTDLVRAEGENLSWSSPVDMGIIPPFADTSKATPGKASEVFAAFKQMPREAAVYAEATGIIGSKFIYVKLPVQMDQYPVTSGGLSQPPGIDENDAERCKRTTARFPGHPEENVNTIRHLQRAGVPDKETKNSSPEIHKQDSQLLTRLSKITAIAFSFALLFFLASYLLSRWYQPDKKTNGNVVQRNVVRQMRPAINLPQTPEPEKTQAAFANVVMADETATSAPIAPVKSKGKPARKSRRQPAIKKIAPDIKIEEEKEEFKPRVAENAEVTANLKQEGDLVVIPIQKSKTLGQKLNTFFKKIKGKKAGDKGQ